MSSSSALKRRHYRPAENAQLVIQTLILAVAVIFALFPIVWVVSAALNPSQSMSSQTVIPPLPETRTVYAEAAGKLLRIAAPDGKRVERSAELILLVEIGGEEKELRAPKNGYVANIRLAAGEGFQPGAALYDIRSSYFINVDTLLNTERKPFLRWMFNSVVIAGVSSLIIVLVTAFSAYSFSRFRFSGRRNLLVLILLVQVFPESAVDGGDIPHAAADWQSYSLPGFEHGWRLDPGVCWRGDGHQHLADERLL